MILLCGRPQTALKNAGYSYSFFSSSGFPLLVANLLPAEHHVLCADDLMAAEIGRDRPHIRTAERLWHRARTARDELGGLFVDSWHWSGTSACG